MPLFTAVRGRGVLRSWLLLEPELLRSEGLAEAFPGRLDELGRAHDPFDLGLRAVSPYVVFCEYLPKGHVLLHAGDDVIGYLLLTRGERGASRASEEPLPEGSLLFAHGDRLVLPNSPTRDGLDLTRSRAPHISERAVHRSARKATSANFAQRLSEKARGYLQRGLTGRRMGTFGPVSASVSRRNPCSECCSQPFSDGSQTELSEVRRDP